MQSGKVPPTRVTGGRDESPLWVFAAHRYFLSVRFCDILSSTTPVGNISLSLKLVKAMYGGERFRPSIYNYRSDKLAQNRISSECGKYKIEHHFGGNIGGN